MEKWNDCPFILQRKICFTFLSGVGSFAASFVIYIISADRILLGLGGIIFVFCLFRSVALWRIISQNAYEMITGVCVSVKTLPLQKYRRIRVIDENGAEITLLLNKQTKVKIGIRYRFYFQNCRLPVLGNEYLNASLSTDDFLGYEELGEFE